jgi:hypothetical protein
VNDDGDPGRPMRAVVAKLIVPAELMAELAQMIAADRSEPGAAFARLPVDAVAHRGEPVMTAKIFSRAEAIERLRQQAADEIERLLAFLDRTEPDPDLEESEPSGIGDQDGLDEQVLFRDWQNVGMV